MIQVTKALYRPDLQGLRAIAITLVILNHSECTLFSGGFVGVDVFFVLSGYLITALLIQEYSVFGKIKLCSFFARRLKRLLPALLVMLGTITFIGSLLLPRYQLTQQIGSLNFAVTWSSNLYFSFSTIDYFSELRTKDFFLHTWSLGIEEQFYLIWPLVIILSAFLINKYKTGLTWHFKFIAILTLFILSSFALSQYWTITHPIWSFYLMPSRIWQFSLGAVAFAWLQQKDTALVLEKSLAGLFYYGEFLGILGLGLIIGSSASFNTKMTYPDLWASVPSFGAFLVITTGQLTNPTLTSRILKHPSLVWIGDRSYSWYLWHWPVLMLGFALGIQPFFDRIAGLVSMSLLMAIFSYRYIELPFWKGRFSKATPIRVILLSILAILLAIFGLQQLLKSSSVNIQSHTSLLAQKARVDLPSIYALGCDAWYAHATVNPCVFGNADAPRTAVLMGDSIGAQWTSLITEIFSAPIWRTIILTKSSCPMVDEDFFYNRIGQVYTVCSEWRNAAIQYLESIQPDIIFLGSTSTNSFSEKQWIEGSSRVFAHLSDTAKDVIVLPGTYKLSFDGPSCIERKLSTIDSIAMNQQAACTEQALTSQADTVANYLKQAASQFPNVKLLNLNDLVCPSTKCSALSPSGLIVFRDQQHLTDSFVRAQVPIVIERLGILGIDRSQAPEQPWPR